MQNEIDALINKLQTAVDALDSVVPEVEGLLKFIEEKGELADLLTAFFHLKDGYDRVDSLRKKLYAVKDIYDKIVIPKALEDAGIDKVSVPGVARSFYAVQRYSASILDKQEGMEWLRNRGGEDLISETVNAGQLAAYLKEMVLEEGVEPPEDIFKFSTYATTGMSKYTPK